MGKVPFREHPVLTGSSGVGRLHAMVRRSRNGVCLVSFAGFAYTLFAAQPIVVDLWPGKTPGDIGIPGEEKSRIYQSRIVGPTKLVTNVTKPTLTVYPAPAEKNSGTAMIICPGGGYWDLFWELEGEEVATWLNANGMTGNASAREECAQGSASRQILAGWADHDGGRRPRGA